MRLLPILVALAVLSGCLGEGPGAPPEDGRDSDVPPAAPEPFVLYLTDGPDLTSVPPVASEPGRVGGGAFLTTWGATDGFAQFLGEPMTESRLVEGNLTFTVHVEAETLSAQIGSFPHVVAYLGTEAALMADGSASAAPVLAPGERATWTGTLALPAAGLLLPKGERPRVLLSVVMSQPGGGDADVVVLVNATSTASRFEGTWRRAADPPAAVPGEARSTEGTLAGSAYARAEEGVSMRTVEVAVPADAPRIAFEVTTAVAAGYGDLDLAVLDSGGSELARSVTPLGRDSIVLFPDAIPEDGKVFVRVTNYGSAAVSYTLVEQRFLPAA